LSCFQNDDHAAAIELQDMMQKAFLKKFKVSPSVAAKLADEVVTGLREVAGGQEVYIPAQNRERRNAAICNDFNGRNYGELTERYGLSRRQIERILKKGRQNA